MLGQDVAMSTVTQPSMIALSSQTRKIPGAKVLGIGACLPEKILTNADLEKIVDTSDEWILARTGIKERRIAPDGVFNKDLVAGAARKALEASGTNPEEIDVLIVGTATPDTLFPSTACWSQHEIGLRHIPVFDISAACSGFLYGYILADGLIAAGTARKVLVVGSEILSRFVNWEDRGTCVLFGDGAGAAVIGGNTDPSAGLLAYTWGADGSLADLLYEPAGGARMPASHETVEKRLHTIHMAGNEVFKNAVRAMQNATEKVMAEAGISVDDIALFVPHQANTRIITATAERAGIPPEKVQVTLPHYGNNSAASIPIAITDALAEGKLKQGDLVLTASFGAGFTWAAAIFRI